MYGHLKTFQTFVICHILYVYSACIRGKPIIIEPVHGAFTVQRKTNVCWQREAYSTAQGVILQAQQQQLDSIKCTVPNKKIRRLHFQGFSADFLPPIFTKNV